jgi:hypothetical protein
MVINYTRKSIIEIISRHVGQMVMVYTEAGQFVGRIANQEFRVDPSAKVLHLVEVDGAWDGYETFVDLRCITAISLIPRVPVAIVEEELGV